VDATMVPMLLAVTGAMLVARQLESRSIYSMRIHVRDPHAMPDGTPQLPQFPGWISQDYPTVSAAAGYGQVVRHLLSLPLHSTLYVVDHDGQLVGTIDASSVEPGNLGAMPADAAKAADLAMTVQPLDSGMSDCEIADFLAATSASEFPVVDQKTGRLIGVMVRNKAG
jgi:hypothetical protein